MKLAIVSTTIHGEKGYLSFDRLAKQSRFSEVCFVISGDKKSVPFDASQFACDVEYYDADSQDQYQCSQPMGWNKIMRRNIALLRAIELNPDFILIIDDDNIPADDYFDVWYQTITTPVTKTVGVTVEDECPAWHNYLKTSDAEIEIFARGFPFDRRWKAETCVVDASSPITNDKIGVYQGISLGDPDIDAVTRVVYPKPISHVREKNYCLKDIWSPYNTQNTMFARCLFPLAFVWPHCGRYDDIYSSYAWQQYLFNNDMYAFVGDAVNAQDRGVRNIMTDFNNEVEGYNRATEVWNSIRQIEAKNVVDFIRQLTDSPNEIIVRHKEFLLAYLRDIEKALK